MYLKALELQGFKSFPDKTVINFRNDVTAIVGPNGSGKSNISDALLWVMGEQRSRALRGGKMEDVIFGGTAKRSPMGFAQVSLVLDNSARIFDRDCDEITITRRYYRGGESEYSINRESCRLRDVTELLMDTGLGRDGYSIIGQGRIAEIVSAKSTDRREVFEEAAGIARFRYRKEESERRLEKTEENLLRVGDKIGELELQVEPLRKQSETAKKYLLLRDELRVLEISLWMESIDRLAEQSELLRADTEKAAQERDGAQAELDRLYAERENTAGRQRDIDMEAERERDKLRTLEAAAAEQDSAAAVLRTNIENNAETLRRLTAEMAEQSRRSDSLQGQIDEHRERISRIENERLEQARSAQALRDESAELLAAQSGAAERLAALHQREGELNTTLSENRSAMILLDESSQGYAGQRAALEQSITDAAQRAQDAERTLTGAHSELEEAQQRLTRTENMVTGRAMLLSGRERSSADCAAQREALTGDLKGIESRLSLLRAQEKELDGFNNSVKNVMSWSAQGTLRGIRGPLARLIRADERVAMAVETALGSALQNIVVDTQRDSKAVIELLKKRGGGRVTLYPLDVMRASYLKSLPENDPGFVGLASELVECDGQYRELIGNLLGRTVVVETLEDAIRIADKSGHSYRIVTLDGQQLNAGGSMTGGSAAKNTGMLSRANEIKSLEAQHEKTEKKLRDIIALSQEADRRLEQLRQELEGAREENAEARQALSRCEGNVAQAELLLTAAKDAHAELARKREELLVQRADCGRRIEALRQSSEKCEQELDALRSELDSAQGESNALDERRRVLEEKLNLVRTEDATLLTEKETVERAAAQLEELRQSMEGEKGRHQDAISASEAQGAALRQKLEETGEAIRGIQAQIAQQQELLRTLTERRLELEGRRAACDRAAEAKNRELMNLSNSFARLEQKMQAAEMEEKQLVDKLWDSYELSRSAAQALRQPLESFSKATRRANELRREISALGTPNLGAIEEYQRVSERYTFLTDQRDDILKSKAEIEEIIRSITQEMETIFLREFRAINECFRETFLELFGGGKAELRLEDEENVLDCGIDIRIQPPGKAVTNISLLSGGEKAFVAIALYFAIIKVRPTPFCIMDEIESALDEANVNVYAEYLHRLSDKTQFIVITHRRGSMEHADQLYGVTMQEKGVSTVLSMDMKEAMKTIK